MWLVQAKETFMECLSGEETKVEDKKKIPFVEQLLDMRDESICQYKGMKPEVALEATMARGRILNAGNPWAESKEALNGLRRQLGYWKAIGASRVVLSWIAYGLELR